MIRISDAAQAHFAKLLANQEEGTQIVAEIAQLLLRNGAAAVQVWCLCRTL